MIGDSIGDPQIRAIIEMSLSLEHLTKSQRKYYSIASSQTSIGKATLKQGMEDNRKAQRNGKI